MQQLPLGVRWHDSSVFASYLRGPNALLVAQLEHLEPASAPLSIWIWGPPGTGKSHLLQAVCARSGEHARLAAYFPLRERQQFDPGALAGCESLDVVCIDDLELIAGAADWERALFNLYNGLQEQRGRLVLAAHSPPAALPWALADLGSRMSASLVLQLRPLKDADQIEVLRMRAQVRGLELPEDTARFLLRRFPRDLRTLCSLLDTLDAASLAAQRRLTVPFIKQVIEETAGVARRK